MRRKLVRAAVVFLAAVLSTAAMAQGAEQNYPSRVIRFIVPASAGGPSDIVARLVADKLGQALRQTVIVENRPGGSLMIGTGAVAKSDPDGYTLLVTTSTPIVTVPFTMKNVPYDVQQDLVTVSHLGSTPLVLYVGAATACEEPQGGAGDRKGQARAGELRLLRHRLQRAHPE